MPFAVGLVATSGGGGASLPLAVPIANSRPATPNRPASAGKNAFTGASRPPATSGDPNTATPRRPLARKTTSDQPQRESLTISRSDTPARTKNIQGPIASSAAPIRLPNSSSAATTTRPIPRPRALPATDSRIASVPRPCLTSRCPGSSANVSSPGTPRNSPGTTSKKVWENRQRAGERQQRGVLDAERCAACAAREQQRRHRVDVDARHQAGDDAGESAEQRRGDHHALRGNTR